MVNVPLPKKLKRPGRRAGRLVKLKALLAFSPNAVWATSLPSDYKDCFSCFIPRRFLAPVGVWLVPMLPIIGQQEDICLLLPRHPSFRISSGVCLHNLRPLSQAAQLAILTTATTRCALVNARLVVNKTFIHQDFFTSRCLDVLFLTETRINGCESSAFSELLPLNSTFINTPRTTGQGGGIVVVLRNFVYHKVISK